MPRPNFTRCEIVRRGGRVKEKKKKKEKKKFIIFTLCVSFGADLVFKNNGVQPAVAGVTAGDSVLVGLESREHSQQGSC